MRGKLLTAAFIMGAAITIWAVNLSSWVNPQIESYNLGRKAYEVGDWPHTIEYMQKSSDAYDRQLKEDSWYAKHILPGPSEKYAALAHFHRGKALLQVKQLEACVDAWVTSLTLNPGDQELESLIGNERKALQQNAYDCRYDYELLLKRHPELSQAMGKGQGNKKGDKKGNQPMPGDDPGKLPGKGPKDDI